MGARTARVDLDRVRARAGAGELLDGTPANRSMSAGRRGSSPRASAGRLTGPVRAATGSVGDWDRSCVRGPGHARGRDSVPGPDRGGPALYTDLPESELRSYRSAQLDPVDFDEFWAATLAEARSVGGEVVVEPVSTGLTTVEVFDVTFPGWAGEPVRAWLRLPATPIRTADRLPAVVEFVGYGGGRGHAVDNLFWASGGFAHLQMDTRGQGSGWSRGDTPDSGVWGPQVPGVMTRGITARETYYYRRLFTDSARAVDAARSLPAVDPARVAVIGTSQGGGSALAAAALVPDVAALSAKVPFLCDFPRALTITDAYPFREVVDYLATHRDQTQQVQDVLGYFDGVNFARRATAPARFSAALMDVTVPPSTVFAAYNVYPGPKDIAVWQFNGHEGGGTEDDLATAAFLRALSTSAGADSPAEEPTG